VAQVSSPAGFGNDPLPNGWQCQETPPLSGAALPGLSALEKWPLRFRDLSSNQYRYELTESLAAALQQDFNGDVKGRNMPVKTARNRPKQ
jgi:hypothetical protein